MAGMRSYGDPCGIARALDLVGERWALLVVRELVLGPKRFTDLRAGLPNASPNVLSQRLHELEEAGILVRRQLGPPAPAWVYELTEWGMELEGILLRLGAWGARSAPVPDGELGVDALILALLSTFVPESAAGVEGVFELVLAGERYRAEVGHGAIDVVRGGVDRPDVIIETSPHTLRDVALGGQETADAVRDGELKLAGDNEAGERFLGMFRRPEPAPTAA
jgi:DNA-binding HxlR family transcriptional regulator